MITDLSIRPYVSEVLPNGLRVICYPSMSPVSYCGFVINAGTRDENPNQWGLAHFVEHMLFKGTKKRKAWHILNRLDSVGGELNAYTTKEETFLYSICLSENDERAIELLSDMAINSCFPQAEMEKEKGVVIDEIRSYQDNPSELIFDEFENILFKGNEMGHPILGEEATLNTFTSASCNEFVHAFYRPENMIFFYYGKTSSMQIFRFLRKYCIIENLVDLSKKDRQTPEAILPANIEVDKNLHQMHAIIGGKGYHYFHPKRYGLYLLNNILGGPCMNSCLNISLREKHALVYLVESETTSYTDTGMFNIYFGCDPDDRDKCIRLIHKELKRFREVKLSASRLHSAVKQLKGQLGVSSDNKETLSLGMGKSFLHFNKYESLPEIHKKLDAITPSLLLEIANEIFDEKALSQLMFS
ncbi:MAG: insulinase family protein [Candidatus Azobacteroides sp.]|nr:insulinase family protein [Candidatus Azobacteroides sp.]